MRLLRRISYLVRQERHARELAEEMDFHRAMLARRRPGGGGFGNAMLAREDARAVWIARWADEVWQDVRYTLRSMRRRPGFSAAAIAILGLGMGATICVFGLLDALTIRSLPVDRPDRLVYFSKPAFSYPIFTELRARMPVFEGIFGWTIDRAYVNWSGEGGEPAPADVLETTGEFFTTLHVTAAIGRTFGPNEAAVAVISYGAWQRRFGASSEVIGRSIHVGGTPFTIVGVAPRGFYGVAPGLAPEVMIPIAGRYAEGSSVFTTTTSSWLQLMARLRDGVSDAQAQAALRTVWPAVLEATTNPGAPPDRRARYLGRQTSLESARTGFSQVRDQFGDPLRLLMALVGLLLAIACASVTNMLLARGVARRKEISVRLAIGAARARIFRQLVTEAFVLALAGGALALLLASWAAGLLVALLTTTRDFVWLDTTPGLRILLFSLALAGLVSLVSALFPAVQSSRGDVIAGLKDAGQPAAGFLRRWSAGKALVALQVALALVLLAGAAVFGRSLARILAQDTGLDARNVLVLSPNSAAAGYKETAQRAFALQLLERLRQLPGVESAALSWIPPISTTMGNWTQSIGLDGGALLKDAPYVYFNGVSPQYFETVGMRLRRGRDFAETDTAGAPRVAIVNEALARQFFPGQDPIGRHITIGRAASRKDLEVIGVVQDAKYRTMQEPQRNIAYLSIAQVEDVTSGRDLFAEVRTANLAATAAQARQIVRTLDPRVPVGVETVADRIRESTLTERAIAILAAALGGTALVLACASLYGLLAYSVSRRRGEIGVRIALGARPASVVWMVQRESIALALAGVAAGLAAAVALARYVATTLLFHVSATDPIALGSAGTVMLAVAALAAYLPARRAAAVDPVVALKTEA